MNLAQNRMIMWTVRTLWDNCSKGGEFKIEQIYKLFKIDLYYS